MLDWIPSLSTAAGLAVIAWLCRNLIISRLTRSVGFEFDRRLEEFRVDLAAKQAQIEALRSGALSSITVRHNALFDRRLKAAEEIWSAVIAMVHAKSLSRSLAAIKYDSSLERAANEERVRDFFKKIEGPSKLCDVDAAKLRPFLSKSVWAYFYAYQSILAHAMLRFELLKNGLNLPQLIDTEGVLTVVRAALPHRADFFEAHGPDALHYVLDELEAKVLESIDVMLKSSESDQAAVAEAASILTAADELTRRGTS